MLGHPNQIGGGSNTRRRSTPVSTYDRDQPGASEQAAAIDAITGAMARPYSAIIAVGAGDLDTQAYVEAFDWQAAVEDVALALRAAAHETGLDTGDVIEAHARPWDDLEAELERPTLPDLVSGPEAAQILGVSRQRVHLLAHQHPDFPAPAYRLGVGSLWFRAGVERFAQDWDRRPVRPPKRTLEARPSSARLTARRPDRAASERNRRLLMTKGDVHTVWDKDDGVWKNKVEGGQRASSIASTKAEAQAKGRELAMKRRVEHHVHNQDGKVSSRNSYGKDPERRRG